MTITYRATFTVVGREIREEQDATKPLSTYASVQTYLILAHDKATAVVDLSKAILREAALDLTMTVAAFITGRLTAPKLLEYASTDIPLKDPESGKYPSRINVMDASVEKGLTVAYTSVSTPEVRDDLYQKDTLNDLVISASDGRDLRHCLVSVNGVFHKVQYAPATNELFIVNGFKNIRNAKKSEIALYDTRTIGGHKILPIDPYWIANEVGQDPWRGIYLNLSKDLSLVGKTIFLVIDGYLYALDDTYQVVGERRLKINTNKMDLVNNFLHNPNTVYEHNDSGIATDPYDPTDQASEQAQAAPTVHDTITHFIEHQWPMAEAQAQLGLEALAVIRYEWTDLYPKTPSISAKIGHFIDNVWETFGLTDTRNAQAALLEIGYSNEYDVATTITKTIPIENLTTPDFVLRALASQHSFLVVLNTDRLYKRVYRLHAGVGTSQFETFIDDVPRGVLLYNRHKSFPYAVLTAQDGQNTGYLGHAEYHMDVYKTSKSPQAIPSPYFDVKDTGRVNEVELIEFYSAGER